MRSSTRSRSAWPASNWALLALLAARFAVGVAVALSVPPWESYDEPGHFQYARYVAVNGHLLTPGDPDAERIWSRFQPPLYYVLIAPLMAFFDLGEQPIEPIRNPYFTGGESGLNYAVAASDPSPAERSQLAALQAARLLGVGLSTLSLLFVYQAARRLWPGRPWQALSAAGLFGFWPQYVFLGSMLTNDLLITALGAPLVYLVVRISQTGVTFRNAGWLALLTAAAILTKLNGLAFLVPAGLAVMLSLARARKGAIPGRVIALFGGLIILTLAALSNLEFVTGQVLKLETLTRFWSNVSTSGISLTDLAYSLVYSAQTFLASFGWGNVEAWPWVYPLYAGILALSGLGLAVALWRGRGSSAHPLPGLFLSFLLLPCLFGMALALTIAQGDRYLVVGRYVMPALAPLVLVLIAGWSELWTERWRARATTALMLMLAGISAGIPFGILAPVYAVPQPADSTDLAGLDTTMAAVYAPGMRLLGARLAEADGPEARLSIFVCWQADRRIDGNFPLQLALIGPDGQGYAHTTTYPGRGNYPTSLWKPGVPFCDRYALKVRGDFPAPALGAVELRFLTSPQDPTQISATGPDGTPFPRSPSIPAVVHGQQPGESETPTVVTDVRFGEAIVLEGYTIHPREDGTGLTVTLFWRSLASVSDDLIVFAHLRSSPTDAYAQADARPRAGGYPTPLWRPGELIADAHDFVFDPAQAPPLTLYVGLYSEAGRLPAVVANGVELPNGEFLAPVP
ncbi:MAG: hypothetical protein JNL73_09435 [Anaerolineales bacterium]|nr:hypothetical protein [Anaerolineales bacterium]